MKNIVLFASGSGTNVENILLYFNQNPIAKVVSVFCNNPNAKVIDRALKFQIPVIIFSKEDFKNNIVLDKLIEYKPDLIVLAGFLLQFPQSIIEKFPNQIINIHPALLPKYGGKGMYGSHVHQLVFENNEIETGITIHYVNENYDEGAILFQESISIEECKSPEEIASKVHQLEHQNYPVIIEQILMQ